MKHRSSFLVPSAPSPSLSKRVFVLVVACSTLGACGDSDDDDDTPVGPEGPVELAITGFLNDQGLEFARDADDVVISCDGTITVLFGPRSGASLENWLLRPPGACESAKQCGYIVLGITPESGAAKLFAGANTSLIVSVSPGNHRLDADLYTGDGEPYLQDGQAVEDTLSGVVFSTPVGCEPSSTGSGGVGGGSSTSSGGAAGAGAAPHTGGAAGDAGAAGQAGEGGAAGAVQG